MRKIGNRIEYTQFNRRYIHWEQKSRTDNCFTPKHYWLITETIKLIVDTGSSVTPIPKTKFNSITTIRPITEDYRDVNNNKRKFEGKTTANIEVDGKMRQLELPITTRQTHPLLRLNWMENWGYRWKQKINTNQSII